MGVNAYSLIHIYIYCAMYVGRPICVKMHICMVRYECNVFAYFWWCKVDSSVRAVISHMQPNPAGLGQITAERPGLTESQRE